MEESITYECKVTTLLDFRNGNEEPSWGKIFIHILLKYSTDV